MFTSLLRLACASRTTLLQQLAACSRIFTAAFLTMLWLPPSRRHVGVLYITTTCILF